MQREIEESIQEEQKLNRQRRKLGREEITLVIRDNIRYFLPNDQLRYKFHHSVDLDTPIPKELIGQVKRLANPALYKERLKTFQNKEILSETYVRQYGKNLRRHMLHPDTQIVAGTLGGNRQANICFPDKIAGYHFINQKSGFSCFVDKNGRRYRTGFLINPKQKLDIINNGNIM